jgi:hypothetical protein
MIYNMKTIAAGALPSASVTMAGLVLGAGMQILAS